jgi:hypothetical protein
MANYAYIEDLQFVELHDALPTNWKNISNFYVLTEEEIKPLGWHKLEKVIPEYDSQTQKLGNERHYILNDIAYETYEVVDIPTIVQTPPPTQEELDARQWDIVRQLRDELMQNFEWRYNRYEREVRLNLTPSDNLENMDAYMQSLADITNQEDPFNITWPEYLG